MVSIAISSVISGLTRAHVGQVAYSHIPSYRGIHVVANCVFHFLSFQVKPLDDYFSVAGQCLCYHDNKLCTNCLTSETEIFTVG